MTGTNNEFFHSSDNKFHRGISCAEAQELIDQHRTEIEQLKNQIKQMTNE